MVAPCRLLLALRLTKLALVVQCSLLVVKEKPPAATSLSTLAAVALAPVARCSSPVVAAPPALVVQLNWRLQTVARLAVAALFLFTLVPAMASRVRSLLSLALRPATAATSLLQLAPVVAVLVVT